MASTIAALSLATVSCGHNTLDRVAFCNEAQKLSFAGNLNPHDLLEVGPPLLQRLADDAAPSARKNFEYIIGAAKVAQAGHANRVDLNKLNAAGKRMARYVLATCT
jgi:hypothetical protein